MPVPQPLFEAVQRKFHVALTADEAASVDSLIDLHRALLRKLSIAETAAAMEVWKKLIKAVDAALSPRFGVEQQPSRPFSLYAGPPLSPDEYLALARTDMAEVLISFMRGEVDANVVREMALLMSEMGNERDAGASWCALKAAADLMLDVVDYGSVARGGISAEDWARLTRLVAALRSELPLREVTTYQEAGDLRKPSQFEWEPFWTQEQWQQYRNLVDEAQLPSWPGQERPSIPQRAPGSHSACLVTVLALAALSAALLAVAHLWPFLAIPVAIVLAALVADHLLRRPKWRYTTVMVSEPPVSWPHERGG
jgi:hypothetical protein